MEANKEEKIQRFETFIDNTLKVQLQHVLDERDAIFQKISDFNEVKKTVKLIQTQNLSEMETLINLGSDHFVQGTVPDTSHILIEVGLGFFAEFSLEEAPQYIDNKIEHLNQKAEALTEKATQIKAHIKLVYEGINELLNLQN